MSFAALLNENGIKKGDNVILLYVDVMDFIVAFYACMYIGAVAVPVDFPTDPSNIEKWELIAKDSGAGFILTSKKSSEMLAKITSLSETLSELDILSEDMAERKMEAVEFEFNATLQYTSGSTGNPKGVMVSYENLLTNIDVIGNYLDLGKSKSFITWLPYYHAMGLIASMLSPIYYGGKSVIVPISLRIRFYGSRQLQNIKANILLRLILHMSLWQMFLKNYPTTKKANIRLKA